MILGLCHFVKAKITLSKYYPKVFDEGFRVNEEYLEFG